MQLVLDLLECGPQRGAVDEPSLEHRPDVREIAIVSPLELRERLRDSVEVAERHRTFAGDKWASVLPARRKGDEVGRGRELDVDRQLVLDLRGREGLGHVDSHASQPAGADRDQQSLDGLASLAEIRDARVDEILTGQLHA